MRRRRLLLVAGCVVWLILGIAHPATFGWLILAGGGSILIWEGFGDL